MRFRPDSLNVLKIIRVFGVFFSVLFTVEALAISESSYTPRVANFPTDQALAFNLIPENDYLKGVPGETFYLFLFVESTEREVQNQLPLNLAVVLDRSGSMDGDKMKYTKEAVEHLIAMLDTDDQLSVVEYSDKATVLGSSFLTSNTDLLLEKVNEIKPKGATNIANGLSEGYELLCKGQQGSTHEFVSRLILLSDGRANRGIMDNEGLRALVADPFFNSAITTSTFGVGADYNETLLSELAAEGGANYEFIGEPEEIVEIFNREMAELSSLVAHNTSFRLKFDTTTVSLVDIPLYPYRLKDDFVEIRFNDLFLGDQKALILQFEVKKQLDSELQFLSQLFFENGMDDFDSMVLDKQVTIKPTDKELKINAGFNHEADLGHALIQSGLLFQASTVAVDEGEYQKADRLLLQSKQLMRDHFKVSGTHPFLKEMMDEINRYKKEISRLRKMRNELKFRLRQKESKHRLHQMLFSPMF